MPSTCTSARTGTWDRSGKRRCRRSIDIFAESRLATYLRYVSIYLWVYLKKRKGSRDKGQEREKGCIEDGTYKSWHGLSRPALQVMRFVKGRLAGETEAARRRGRGRSAGSVYCGFVWVRIGAGDGMEVIGRCKNGLGVSTFILSCKKLWEEVVSYLLISIDARYGVLCGSSRRFSLVIYIYLYVLLLAYPVP